MEDCIYARARVCPQRGLEHPLRVEGAEIRVPRYLFHWQACKLISLGASKGKKVRALAELHAQLSGM